MPRQCDLLVFSHRRWHSDRQRTQQLFTRLGKNRRVFFIEEPVYEPQSSPHWHRFTPTSMIDVYQPRTPADHPGFHAEQQSPYLKRLVEQLLDQHHPSDYVVWLTTPLAVSLLDLLEPRVVLYDCIEEPTATTPPAPREFANHEAELLRVCDLVFTGGQSLHRAKQHRHARVYCFPEGVDRAHFAQAIDGRAEPVGQASLPQPRLGYLGEIDGGLDWGLITHLATRHPDWQIVLVGPITRTGLGDLPSLPNLHYFGERSYEELPAILGGWDAAILPLACQEATPLRSVTAPLAYMAAERPLVSTPIPEIVGPYRAIARVAATREEFVAACEETLGETTKERARRIELMRDVLAKSSWDSTADAMSQLLDEAGATLPGASDFPGRRQSQSAASPAVMI